MERIALDLGFIKIYWYSIMIFFGVLIGFLVAYCEIKRKKIDLKKFENMAFYAILFGFLGARIYYVLFNLDYYLANPMEIIEVWNGGLAIHGGIIGAVLAIYVCCKKYAFSFLEILDICVPALIVGQVIGRWGNFFNSEAHGIMTTKEQLESLFIPGFIIQGMLIGGVYYHPTFLYESFPNFIGFIILMFLRKSKKMHVGIITGFYFIWYGLIRFFVEGLRTDSLMLSSLRIAQVVSLLMVVLGIVLIITARKRPLYNRED